MEVLTLEDSELERLEGIISKNLTAFYEVGRALMQIRDGGLYKLKNGGEYRTFEEYCQGVWDMGRNYANKLIESSRVIGNLGTTVPNPPTSERQARPLSRLPPEQQAEAWEKAVETAPEGKVTAAHVEKVVLDIVGKEREVKIRKIDKAINEIKVSPVFERAYHDFYREVQNAKLSNWEDTNKDEALKLVNYIIDLITIN